MGMMVNSVKTLLARTGMADLLGLQMGGTRDLYQVFGWKSRPAHRDFIGKYKRQGMARRIVDAPAKALWSDPPIIKGDDVFQKAWDDLVAKIPVFSYLLKLDKLVGVGEFAVLVVGIDDGRALDRPVNPVREASGAQRKVTYLQPYAEGSVLVKEWETNATNPRYGLPISYTITPGSFGNDLQTRAQNSVNPIPGSFTVHHTRVLHVAENALESPVFGQSRLECVYNDLDDLLKVGGGAAEVYWLNARNGLHIDVDKDMELDPDSADALSEEMDEYANQLRRTIRTRGVTVKPLESKFADPTGIYDTIISSIAAATGIPKRELMGSEAGQLASQQDRANWAQRCAERVAEFGQPVVLIPFIRLLIDAGVLPTPTTMSIEWPDAFKMNPLERAQTSAQMARSAANLSKMMLTVQQLNHANAVDSMPTETPVGGGGFFGNAGADAGPDQTGKKPTKDPKKAIQPEQPDTIVKPALFPTRPPTITLLSEEECRSIIGFGKHMPVFDDKQDSAQISGRKDPSSEGV
jgi:hypothetical protein